jgi:hypothetical protein
MTGYPFRVSGGGSPSMFAGPIIEGAMLKGGLTAHYGVIIGVACRLVEDPASPLKFSAIGELEYTTRDTKPRDATERWVLLAADGDVLRANAGLWGKRVRIEYAPTPNPNPVTEGEQ